MKRAWVLTGKKKITIQENAKEDFKKLMNWNDETFNENTIEIRKHE